MSPRPPFFVRRAGLRPLFAGVHHLPPLPGAPRGPTSWQDLIEGAIRDAQTLAHQGADAIILENFGDTPFCRDQVPPITVAAMTRIALEIRDATPDLALGINVLRNDALSALAVADTAGARFIRVNVLTGAAITDQGWVEGQARSLAQSRRQLDSDAQVAADVHVKHATPLDTRAIEDVAEDTWTRGGADALILTGRATGAQTSPDDIRQVRDRCPDAPLWVGSGVTAAQLPKLIGLVDGVIVGTALHIDRDLRRPLDPARVAAFAHALRTPSERRG